MTQETEQERGKATPPPSRTASSVDEQLRAERIRALFSDYDKPLDDEKWTSTPHAGQQRGARALLARIRRHRDHRRELKRARKAAQAAFGFKPRLSTRKRATLMMGAGAMSLTAFSGPPTTSSPSGTVTGQTLSLPQEQGEIRLPAALLKASDAFKQALIEEEGVRYTVYRDVAGYPTVGVGHLVTPGDKLRVGDRIDEDRVLALLDRDLQIAEQGVRKLVGSLPLHQHEFDALLDLVYNVGAGNVSPDRSPRLNAAIENGDYDAISDELDYTHAAGKVARGLEFRSERRAQIFMDASYDDPRGG